MNSNKQEFIIDRISFELGMINCFIEMVACGVKKLALSPPIPPEDYDIIAKYSGKAVEEFGIKSYLDRSLMITDLQTEDFTKGKWSVLYYEKDEVLEKYLELKQRKDDLVQAGQYTRDKGRLISQEFMRLLSYPEDKIQERLNTDNPESPYMMVE